MKITISFDDIVGHKDKSTVSDSDPVDLPVKNLKESRELPLVKAPDEIVNHTKNYHKKYTKNHENELLPYIRALESHGNKVKFLTIRPHDEFIFGKYNVLTRKDAVKTIISILKENIKYPFAGSIESNNSIFVHCHLMVLCSNTELNILHQKLRDLLTSVHRLGNKQYAVVKKRPKDIGDRLFMIRYYLGLKYKEDSFYSKKSYLFNIFYDMPKSTIPDEIAKEFTEILNEFNFNKFHKKNKISSKVYHGFDKQVCSQEGLRKTNNPSIQKTQDKN